MGIAFEVEVTRKGLPVLDEARVAPLGSLRNSNELFEEEPAKTERKRPGPRPDTDWPEAIAKVTQDCIAAGYKQPLKRGDKAAIQARLLNFMAMKDKYFSDDIAAKHAEKVIVALPDN